MTLTPVQLVRFLRNKFVESVTRAGGTVLVDGGPGSGKTTALRELAQHAEAAGALVLTAAGAPDEQCLCAGIVEQLVETPKIPDNVAERLGGVLSAENDDSPQRINEAGSAFFGLCVKQPTVIVVDDIQFADDWSVRLLHHLHRRAHGTRLLVVLARWSLPSPTASPLLAAHDQVRLGPMTLPEVTELARRSGTVDDRQAAQIHELSAGIPLLVHGLLAGDAAALAAAVRAVFQRWGTPLVDVLRALAVLGDHADAELVARLVDAPVGHVEDVLDVLANAGFVASGRLGPPAVASALLAGLSGDERVRLHRRAAAVAHQAARDTRVIAEQLVAAGRAEPGWPVASVLEAADRALSEDDADFAARCMGLALNTVDDERRQRDVRVALAGAAWRLNPERAARHVVLLREDAVMAPSGAERHALIRDALWRGDQAALAAALDSFPPAEPQTRAEVMLAREWVFGPNAAMGQQDDDESAPWVCAARTVVHAWRTGNAEHATAGAELLLRGCRLADLSLEAISVAITVLATGDRMDLADHWSGRFLAEATARGAATWQAVLGAARSTVTLLRGDPAGAARHATAALELLGSPGWGAAIGCPLATAVLGHTAVGDHHAAAELLRIPVPAAMAGTVGGLRYLHARGRHLMATDRALAAISDFDRCRRRSEHWGTDLTWLVPWREDLDKVTAQLAEPDAEVPAQQGFDGPPHLVSAPTQKLDPMEADLSEAERRVAELAALGRSNRQISADLFITVSTVEQHLTRVYKKLGVIGRGDLAGRLGLVA
jgi:DNA-binding CsgD family transcriptional regulator